MNSPPLLDPQFLTAAYPVAPSVCRINMATAPVADPYGATNSRAKQTYAVRPGHDAIKCTLSIDLKTKATDEQRSRQMTTELARFTCKLLGVFPNISLTDQAVIDGTNYEIQGIEMDSQNTFTNLQLRTITV